jgi:hypothetical protein
METVADLVKALLALPQDAPVRRVMTAELGVVEIETVYVEQGPFRPGWSRPGTVVIN